MEIRPIKTAADHRAALKEIDKLWNAKPGSAAESKLDILATLVAKYEEDRWPITDDDLDPIDLLNFAISDLGHTQAELAELLHSRPRASEVLNRRRHLTVEWVRIISEAWGIPAALLVRPIRPQASR
jgi:HTH-type transcriptional regulator / antitoxin HigA